MKKKERWKPVVGFEGSYEVSDQGRVRSIDRIVTINRVWRERHQTYSYCRKGRVLAISVSSPQGYIKVQLGPPPGNNRWVHSLVLEAFVSPRPKGQVACHVDDIPANNKLSNLYWGTPSQNVFDAIRNKRIPIGLDHHRSTAKLKRTQIPKIRKRLETQPVAAVAAELKLSVSTIYALKSGRSWKGVE